MVWWGWIKSAALCVVSYMLVGLLMFAFETVQARNSVMLDWESERRRVNSLFVTRLFLSEGHSTHGVSHAQSFHWPHLCQLTIVHICVFFGREFSTGLSNTPVSFRVFFFFSLLPGVSGRSLNRSSLSSFPVNLKFVSVLCFYILAFSLRGVCFSYTIFITVNELPEILKEHNAVSSGFSFSPAG